MPERGAPLALGAFVAAVAFFTRIPRPAAVAWSDEHDRVAAAFAPLVGWIVGLAGAFAFVAAACVLPATVAAVACVAVTAWLTGTMHEDGFADFCDGFGGGRDREHTLAIMRDPRVGSFAATGLALLLIAKVAALAAIAPLLGAGAPGAIGMGVVIVAGHALSRFVAVSFMHTHVYVRPEADARGRRLSEPMGAGWLAVAAAGGLAPLAALAALGGWALAAAALAVSGGLWLVLASRFERRLGGYTGDCLGAAQQLSEMLFYATVCAVLGAA